ncbi:N-formylglutamate amidohydrolase [Roseibium sp.]|uniref:N-formylglutamate amidohydrolase n=1 Tax=Roseibium sp. TaxID=1936156 RepID=UPI003A96C960
MIIVHKGDSPLILCLPHTGVDIPPAVEARFSATGRMQADISWRLEQVMEVGRELGATIIRSTVSRYVIDLDHAVEASDVSDVKSLCPTVTLDQKTIYKTDEEPGPVEAEQRMLLFYNPFHQALEAEVARLRKMHQQVVVCDSQSVRSRIRGFIDDELAALNIGTDGGKSCADGLRNTFVGSFTGLKGFSVAVDDRFRGGHITRKFGQPDRGIHALTLVIAQRCYLRHESPPFEPDKIQVTRLKAVLADGLARVVDWAKGHAPEDTTPDETPSRENAPPMEVAS